jgi:hypothetical protein
MRRYEMNVRPIILRLSANSTIIKEPKVILSLKAKTYGAPIVLDRDERGIIFLGSGDYLVNSKISTSVGAFSKQYVDSFMDWGLIVGQAERWADARRQFIETEDTPDGFVDRDDFLKKAEEELHRMIRDQNIGSIEKADWFYKVKGLKDAATLHCMGNRIAFIGCHATLTTMDEGRITLIEGTVNLVMHGDKIAVVSGAKETQEKELAVGSLSLLPRTLEKLGYEPE